MPDTMSEVTWASLPNKDQLFVLVLARFSEPVVRTSIQVNQPLGCHYLALCPKWRLTNVDIYILSIAVT